MRVWRMSNDMTGYLAVIRRTNCKSEYKPGKTLWDKQLGQIKYEFRNMRWLSTLGSLKCTLPVAQFTSIILIYLCVPPCYSVHNQYPYITIHPKLASPYQSKLLWWREMDFPTSMASKCISKFPQSSSPGTPLTLLKHCLQTEWPYV
jgi:hypothetical protein